MQSATGNDKTLSGLNSCTILMFSRDFYNGVPTTYRNESTNTDLKKDTQIETLRGDTVSVTFSDGKSFSLVFDSHELAVDAAGDKGQGKDKDKTNK